MFSTPPKHLTLWLVAASAALIMLLSGCGAGAAPPEPAPEAEPEAASPEVVSATGEVLPAEAVTLSFTIGGQVAELLVKEGDTVQAGEVVARLDTTVLDAEIATAQAALDVAEANLQRARAGPHPEEVAEAQANLYVAGANTAVAAAQLEEVQSGNVEQSEVLNAQADLQQMYIEMVARRTEADWTANTEIRPQDYENEELRTLPPLKEDAQQRYEAAMRDYEEAYARLLELQQGPNPGDIRAAQADVSAAGARYQAEQANLELVEAGPREVEIAVAEAAVARARVALERARLNRLEAELAAPFDGTVASVFVRRAQYVNPGEAILEIADLSTLHVETTDLNEIDVAAIAIGDPATVTFDALPGVSVAGTVTHIDPKAEEGAGVNFTVWIELEEVPKAVRWGMTAFVDIPVGE